LNRYNVHAAINQCACVKVSERMNIYFSHSCTSAK
jgi:hypothetical protein